MQRLQIQGLDLWQWSGYAPLGHQLCGERAGAVLRHGAAHGGTQRLCGLCLGGDPMPEGQAHAQHQVTAQAQAAQALRAAVSGTSPLHTANPLPAQFLPERRVSRPLPEVKPLELETSHIERLLLEDGDRVD